MCGIFGCISFNPGNIDLAREALHTLRHRGRDQWGEWSNNYVYLGHQRLSIIDLSENARQPFIDRDVIIVVNGEIYNYLDLRKELKEAAFKSNSDSEVILHGYKAWGIDGLLNKLDGMYAFAIYDRKKRKLYLAKDRWGKKPLFYAISDGRFIFASEIKAILKFAPELRVFSYEGIKHWISYRGSHSANTIFHNIKKLAPATYLSIDENLNYNVRKYYEILEVCLENFEQGSKNFEDIASNLSDLLDKAITRRLMSDVPLGLQLSGGVDSSIIAGLLHKKVTQNFHTFSVVFTEPEYKSYSEESFSTKVADRWGYSHHSFGIKKKSIGESFEEVLYIFDGMLDYPNAIPLYLLNMYAKKYISVALTGEAADELFGGYTKYRRLSLLGKKAFTKYFIPDFMFRLNWYKKLAILMIRPLYLTKKYKGNLSYLLDNFNSYISPETMNEFFGPQEIRLLDTINKNLLKELPFNRQLLIVDHMTYLYSLLDRQDRTSMGANIEARLPYLDKKLVEWSAGLEPSLLFDAKETKKPLKYIASEMYGKDFAYRRKKGFPLPIDHWLFDPECFGTYYNKIFDDSFLLYERINRNKLIEWMKNKAFDNKLINYRDSERIWMGWFLMVIRTAQDVFNIRAISD